MRFSARCATFRQAGYAHPAVREVGESIILPDLSELPVNLMVDSSELWDYTRNSLVLVVLATLFPQNTAGFYGVGVGWSLQHKRAVE